MSSIIGATFMSLVSHDELELLSVSQLPIVVKMTLCSENDSSKVHSVKKKIKKK